MILESALIIYLPKCTNIYNNAYPFICSYSGGNNFPISRKNLSDFYGNYRPNIRPNIRPDSAEYSVSADTSFYCIGRSLESRKAKMLNTLVKNIILRTLLNTRLWYLKEGSSQMPVAAQALKFWWGSGGVYFFGVDFYCIFGRFEEMIPNSKSQKVVRLEPHGPHSERRPWIGLMNFRFLKACVSGRFWSTF